MISLKKRKKKFLQENFLPSKGFSLYLTLKPPESLFEGVEGVFYISMEKQECYAYFKKRGILVKFFENIF